MAPIWHQRGILWPFFGWVNFLRPWPGVGSWPAYKGPWCRMYLISYTWQWLHMVRIFLTITVYFNCYKIVAEGSLVLILNSVPHWGLTCVLPGFSHSKLCQLSVLLSLCKMTIVLCIIISRVDYITSTVSIFSRNT